MDEHKALDSKELEQVSGGWEFQSENNKYHQWLNGYNVKCPYCGNESADVVKRIGASPSEVAFNCQNCHRFFYLRHDMLYNRVYLVTDNR